MYKHDIIICESKIIECLGLCSVKAAININVYKCEFLNVTC